MPKNTYKVMFQNLGLIRYKAGLEYQENLFQKIISQQRQNDKLPLIQQKITDNYLLFCEHYPVFTIGKSGKSENLLVNDIQLNAANVELFNTNRGGDITFHGPGQIVGYPILNLRYFATGIRDYIEKLESAVIMTGAEYGLEGKRMVGATGVWIDPESKDQARKICSIGVRSSYWITMHGFALNVNTDLSYFKWINPCGFTDKQVTSMEKEVGMKLDSFEVAIRLKTNISRVFNNFQIVQCKIGD